MFEPPFHVAGGALPVDRFADLRCQPAPEAAPVTGSRRRKLWEIRHKFHCPLIGVCFGVGELRGLMAKVMHLPREATDFMLHTSAVGACEERSRLAEVLQKTLEKRFQTSLRRFAAAKTSDALRGRWRDAVGSGSELPGALWACWTHPACDAQLEQEIYGDIHMIQHQVGSGTRAELASLDQLRSENGELRRQLAAARAENATLRAEKTRETALLGQRVGSLQIDLAGKEAWAASLSAQLDQLRQSLPELKDRQSLARRAHDAEAKAEALHAHAGQLAEQLAAIERRLEQAEQSLRPPGVPAENRADSAVDRSISLEVSGKCVLCVGGRSGAVDAYRQVIEQRGGRFLHHDGGQEESLHRIDAALAAADLVICQAGCISHNAYWRVKEQCKRSGKPCLYMKRGGVSGLSRLIDQGGAEQPLALA